MYRNIVFATDLLDGSHALSLQAKYIAEKFDATLHLLHVVEPPITTQYAHVLGFAEIIEPPTKDAEIVLNTLGDELGVPVENQHVYVGTPHYHIIEAAKKLNFDAIIIGSHVPHRALHHFLGSSANAIVQGAHCDVITLRAPFESKDNNV